MLVNSADVLSLMEKIEKEDVLSSSTINQVNKIVFDFGNVDAPEGDIVFVFGNPTCVEDRAVKAVELWKKNPSMYLLLSGGAPDSISGITEAERMCEYCLNCDVPIEQIILEKESSTTVENVLFSAKLVHDLRIANPRIIAVSSASHMRRVIMNLEKYRHLFPEGAKIVPCQSVHPSCNPKSWYMYNAARKTVALELKYIYLYLVDGGYSHFDINP